MDVLEILQVIADELEKLAKEKLVYVSRSNFHICGKFALEQDGVVIHQISCILNEVIQAELAAQSCSQQKD